MAGVCTTVPVPVAGLRESVGRSGDGEREEEQARDEE